MADLSFHNQDGVSRSISDTPPNHYTFKIHLFSQLTKNNIEKYSSTDFQAGGYKWKLVVHPNGNKNKGITDHISLYLHLVPDSSKSLPWGWEIRAHFRLYLLNQKNDTYFTLQDTTEKGRRFHEMNLEWGFDKFIAHTTFKDAANGYLVNDACVFGAEVYVCEENPTGKGECLSMIKDAITYKHTWKIDNFNNLTDECVDSIPFSAADYKWKMQMYPKGKGSGTNAYISLYLALVEPETLPPATNIYAKYTLRIVDQIDGVNDSETSNYWFSASNARDGWDRFMMHARFNRPVNGFLVKNTCIVEAEITVHWVACAI